MNVHSDVPLKKRWVWVAVSGGSVLLWRVAAYYAPSSFVAIPDGLHLPLALLGVLFLVSGVWAWWARPNHWTALFLIYGLCLAVHWGGAIGVGEASLEMALFWVYLAVTAMGDAALLNLALIYPHSRHLAPKWKVALYAPAAIALLLAPIAALTPQQTLGPAVGLVLLIANLLSLAAGIIFLVRLFTVDAETRRAAHLPLIVTGMVSGSVLALLGAGGVLPGVPESWNLALGTVPVTLAVALVFQSLGRRRDDLAVASSASTGVSDLSANKRFHRTPPRRGGSLAALGAGETQVLGRDVVNAQNGEDHEKAAFVTEPLASVSSHSHITFCCLCPRSPIEANGSSNYTWGSRPEDTGGDDRRSPADTCQQE